MSRIRWIVEEQKGNIHDEKIVKLDCSKAFPLFQLNETKPKLRNKKVFFFKKIKFHEKLKGII